MRALDKSHWMEMNHRAGVLQSQEGATGSPDATKKFALAEPVALMGHQLMLIKLILIMIACSRLCWPAHVGIPVSQYSSCGLKSLVSLQHTSIYIENRNILKTERMRLLDFCFVSFYSFKHFLGCCLLARASVRLYLCSYI